MPRFIDEIDLHGLNTNEAKKSVTDAIHSARRHPTQFKVLKFLHGFHRGNAIAAALEPLLDDLKGRGEIAMWVTGSEWGMFNPELRELTSSIRLKSGSLALADFDHDYNTNNPGITLAIVWPKRT